MSKRRTHSPKFKAGVTMEVISSGRKTIQEIAAEHAIHPIAVTFKKGVTRGLLFRQPESKVAVRVHCADRAAD